MRLIIGGRSQGKLKFALRDTGYTMEQTSHGAFEGRTVLNQFHMLTRSYLQEGLDLAPLLDTLAAGDYVVICDEIGLGVVPMDAFERRWREETGRACQFLAAKARRVDRVYCGVATRLK